MSASRVLPGLAVAAAALFVLGAYFAYTSVAPADREVTFTADRPGTFQFRCSVVCASTQAHHSMDTMRTDMGAMGRGMGSDHMPELTHHFQMTGKLVVET